MAADSLDPDAWQISYLIDTRKSPRGISVTVTTREQKANGAWGKPRPWRVNDGSPTRVQDPRDGEILALLLGSNKTPFGLHAGQYIRHIDRKGESMFFLRRPTEALLLERMCRTGRCLLSPTYGQEPVTLRWDAGPA